MKKRCILNFLIIILLPFIFTSCSDEWDKFYERPDFLQGNAYEVLQKRGNYTIFLKGIELAGYLQMLEGHGLCTVLAPNDEAFTNYLKENGYASIEAIPEDTLNILISYHLLKYSYTKELLMDFRPDGIQNTETAEGVHYKHITYAKDPVRIMTNKDGRKYNIYQHEKKLPVFSSLLFQGKGIDAEYNYKYFFPNSNWYGDDETLYAANAGITEYEIPTDNGYIFLVDDVIRPLRTIYEVLEDREEYSTYAALYDKFKYFYYSSSISSSYAQAGDSLYLCFHKPLEGLYNEETPNEMDMNSPNNRPSIFSQSRNAYNTYAPDNASMDYFLKTYLSGYSDYDEVAYYPVFYLLSEHTPRTTRSIVFPEEISKRKVNSDYGLIYDFDVDSEVGYREMCTNGPFYGLNNVIVPILFRSVTGDVLSSPDYKIFTYMLHQTEMTQLVDIDGITTKYTLFAIPDAVFNEWGYYYQVAASGAFTEPTIKFNEITISPNNAEHMRNYVSPIIDMHIVNEEIKDFNKKAIYETRGGGYLKVWGGGVYGEDNSATPFEVKLVPSVNTTTNGITYKTPSILTAIPEEGLSLNTLLQYDEYRQFYNLLEQAGLIEDGEITIFDQTQFMIFVPTNEVLIRDASIIPQDSEELAEWLKYYFVSLNANTMLSYVYPGIDNEYRYGSFYTLKADQLLSNAEETIFTSMNIEDNDDTSIFRLKIRNNTKTQLTYTLADEFPVFARDGIVYQIEDVIQPE